VRPGECQFLPSLVFFIHGVFFLACFLSSRTPPPVISPFLRGIMGFGFFPLDLVDSSFSAPANQKDDSLFVLLFPSSPSIELVFPFSSGAFTACSPKSSAIPSLVSFFKSQMRYLSSAVPLLLIWVATSPPFVSDSFFAKISSPFPPGPGLCFTLNPRDLIFPFQRTSLFYLPVRVFFPPSSFFFMFRRGSCPSLLPLLLQLECSRR